MTSASTQNSAIRTGSRMTSPRLPRRMTRAAIRSPGMSPTARERSQTRCRRSSGAAGRAPKRVSSSARGRPSSTAGCRSSQPRLPSSATAVTPSRKRSCPSTSLTETAGVASRGKGARSTTPIISCASSVPRKEGSPHRRYALCSLSFLPLFSVMLCFPRYCASRSVATMSLL